MKAEVGTRLVPRNKMSDETGDLTWVRTEGLEMLGVYSKSPKRAEHPAS